MAGKTQQPVQVAGYVRVSTQQQLEENTHETQKKQIRDYVDRQFNDANLQIFEDLAISGQSDERESYKKLINNFDKFDVIVVRELSRFGRDPLTVMQDVEKIIDTDGTEFVSTRENFDTSSAMGKAFLRILSVVNGMYADLRREQAIRAAERRRERGDPVGRPKKLNPDEIDQVVEYRDKGLSYESISRLVETDPDTDVESIDRSTIKRYVDEREDD